LAKAQAELDVAEQKLDVAKERLRMVLGPFVDNSAAGASGDFKLRAPFGGRIEAVHTVPGSRVAQGEPTVTLADTSQLWVSAMIHQHDWDALQVEAAATVRVTVPAIPQEEFQAQISFVGPEVSPTTRAISLVAQLDNSAGRFRPGMFAWVALPMGSPHCGLTVPTAAIQRHESNAFVFCQEGEGRFRRVDVSVGIETPEFVEITAGLSAGQQVVDRGAFYLKSELLLEQEEE
jgi:RND family efflux transporter MFP subunit